MRRTEQGVITMVRPRDILVEDDFGEPVYVSRVHVVGTPREGATCILVPQAVEGTRRYRAFVEPEECRGRRCPDESGVIFVGEDFLKCASR